MEVVHCIVDAHGYVRAVNTAWSEFAHANGADEATTRGIGLNYLEPIRGVQGTDCDVLLESFSALFARSERFEHRYTCHSPETRRWFELRAQPVSSAGDPNLFLLSHVRLPTIDARALNSENILHALDEGVIALDDHHRVVVFNRAAQTIFGVSAEEAIGEGIEDLFVDRPLNEPAQRQILRGRRSNGTELVLSVQSTLANYHEGWLRVLVVSNLTAQHALEVREQELQQQLERSQRFEALGLLAGGIAHEVNNALAIVLANAAILAHERPREEVLGIDTAARHAAGVVRQLMMFARGLPGPTESCELREEILRSTGLLRAILPSTVSLEVDAGDQPVVACVSSQELRQIVFNLVTNAAHSIAKHGLIRVRLAQHGDRVSLRVEDDGPGIDPAVADRIFEPFVSTKPDDEGSGLGLSVVHGILTRRDGLIRLESTPLGGACFVVEVIRDSTSNGEADTDPDSETLGANASVLIVDDEASLARALGRVLRASGLDVSVCGTLSDARAQMEQTRFDVLLTDQALTDGSGIGLVAELRERGDRIAAAILTGSPGPDLARQARALNCAFAAKPLDTKQLILLLRTALDLSTAASSQWPP